jgi:hypothetical protein
MSQAQTSTEVREWMRRLPYGTITVRRTDVGYVVTINIDSREVGRGFAEKFVASLMQSLMGAQQERAA